MTIDFVVLLNPAEARVLGSLLEKEATTPDYYPLSLNALVNACNQRSNREPVTNLDEEEVHLALRRLEDIGLAGRARSADGRVTKYEHWLGEAYNFTRAESALICVLLLRGPQTPGELRGRTDRLHSFAEIADVLAGLQKLAERTPSLVAVLPRQPGTKESRYTHLLCGPVESVAASVAQSAYSAPMPSQAFARPSAAPDDPAHEPRIAHLESRIAELEQKIDALNKRFDDLFGD
jgi:uncharacterized protein YceH (UPF0502 family)